MTAPIDPLFVDSFHLKETQDAMRALNKDKSPGPDGITNRMLAGGGKVLTGLLHDFLSSLWLHEIQPRAWELSLMQPIYKGGNKLKTDPASYRGILKQCPSKTLRGLTTTPTDTVNRGTRHAHSQPAGHEARPTDPRRHLLPTRHHSAKLDPT